MPPSCRAARSSRATDEEASLGDAAPGRPLHRLASVHGEAVREFVGDNWYEVERAAASGDAGGRATFSPGRALPIGRANGPVARLAGARARGAGRSDRRIGLRPVTDDRRLRRGRSAGRGPGRRARRHRSPTLPRTRSIASTPPARAGRRARGQRPVRVGVRRALRLGDRGRPAAGGPTAGRRAERARRIPGGARERDRRVTRATGRSMPRVVPLPARELPGPPGRDAKLRRAAAGPLRGRHGARDARRPGTWLARDRDRAAVRPRGRHGGSLDGSARRGSAWRTSGGAGTSPRSASATPVAAREPRSTRPRRVPRSGAGRRTSTRRCAWSILGSSSSSAASLTATPSAMRASTSSSVAR